MQSLEEFNAIFSRIVGCFPSWNPDKRQAASWFQELKNYNEETIMAAVRSFSLREGTAFAPSIFQIVAELEKLTKPAVPLAATVWEDVLQICRGQMHKTVNNIECLPEAANIALRSVGGTDAIGFVQMESLPFIRREFIQIYESCIDAGRLDPMPILAAPKKQNYAIGSGSFSTISGILGDVK